MARHMLRLLALLAVLAQVACATPSPPHPNHPFETTNRRKNKFNESVDAKVLR
ncbi:MAG: hypothetical protein RL520_1266, partial [Pseudomonadota bacterium]